MEWNEIVEYMTSNQMTYAVGTGIAVGSLILGNFLGRTSRATRLRYAEIEHEGQLSKQETRRAELAVEQAGLKDKVELTKLQDEERAKVHDRTKDIEDRDYARKDKEKNATDQELVQRREHQIRMIATAASSIEGDLRKYLTDLQQYAEQSGNAKEDEVTTKLREGHRLELVQEYLASKKERGVDIKDRNYTVSDETQSRIDTILDAKYPSTNGSFPRVPKSLNRLVELLETQTGQEE